MGASRRISPAASWTLVLGLAGLQASAQEPQQPPVKTDKVEEEQVRLVILDTVVVDRDGRTVSDLTIDDFQVFAGGDPVAVDTLDVDCPGGGSVQPAAVRHPGKRDRQPAGDRSRRIVLAVDYLHLHPMRRPEVLLRAREIVQHTATSGDEVMVVALNGGLRIEQPFSTDHDRVLHSLERMEYDVTLWQPDYFHLHEASFVDPMVALMDLLGTYDGPKAVVLFSTMRDVPLDKEFDKIAAAAAASRCSFYPVDVGGLRELSGGGPPDSPG